MNWYGCLYCHTNLINGKKYWGQTLDWNNPNIRWKSGEGYKPKKNKDSHFYNAIKKYGWDNFQHTVVTYCLDKETLDKAEDFWILATKSNENKFGYNKRTGGGSRGKHSEESKEKCRKTKIGDKNPMFGKTVSEETRQKLRISNTGNKMTEEQKLKNSLSKIGEKNPMFGKKCINRSLLIEATNIKTGEKIVFRGTIEAKELGFHPTAVHKCSKGYVKTHKGYTFKYLSTGIGSF